MDGHTHTHTSVFSWPKLEILEVVWYLLSSTKRFWALRATDDGESLGLAPGVIVGRLDFESVRMKAGRRPEEARQVLPPVG